MLFNRLTLQCEYKVFHRIAANNGLITRGLTNLEMVSVRTPVLFGNKHLSSHNVNVGYIFVGNKEYILVLCMLTQHESFVYRLSNDS